MNPEEIYELCTSLPHAEACFPFDEVTLVFKVGGRMFAVNPLDKPDMLILKCDPERAVELRERYGGIAPAWHFNKKHWNMIDLKGSVPRPLITEMTTHSYNLVTGKLPRRIKEELGIY